jgi:hypothetical protein
MSPLWYVGILNVDRSKREIKLCIIRAMEDMTLPRTYNFFASLLYYMYEDSGFGGSAITRMEYEDAGLINKPTGDIPDGLDYDMSSKNESEIKKYIEHVEMIRYCGTLPSYDDNMNDDDDSNEIEGQVEYNDNEKLMLQAEYIIRVTDNKYISCRADPNILGHFYFDTASYEDFEYSATAPIIPLGTYQNNIMICPLDHFRVKHDQLVLHCEYANQHHNDIHHVATTLQKIITTQPIINFDVSNDNNSTGTTFSRLVHNEQQQFISILSYANRKSNDNNTIFSKLNRDILFHVLSYIPVYDAKYELELRQTYLSLQSQTLQMFAHPSYRDNASSHLFFEGLHYVSMKHSSIVLLIRRMNCLADEMEVKICKFHDDHTTEVQQIQTMAQEYGHQLYTLFEIMSELETNHQLDLKQFFPNSIPIAWMKKRLRVYIESSNIQDFLTNIFHVSPDDLRV